MNCRIRTAVPADEGKIRELFLEMLRMIYRTEDVNGYPDGYLDRFWSKSEDRIYIADNMVSFLGNLQCPGTFPGFPGFVSLFII